LAHWRGGRHVIVVRPRMQLFSDKMPRKPRDRPHPERIQRTAGFGMDFGTGVNLTDLAEWDGSSESPPDVNWNAGRARPDTPTIRTLSTGFPPQTGNACETEAASMKKKFVKVEPTSSPRKIPQHTSPLATAPPAPEILLRHADTELSSLHLAVIPTPASSAITKSLLARVSRVKPSFVSKIPRRRQMFSPAPCNKIIDAQTIQVCNFLF
jgi:hypothetical protein